MSIFQKTDSSKKKQNITKKLQKYYKNITKTIDIFFKI